MKEIGHAWKISSTGQGLQPPHSGASTWRSNPFMPFIRGGRTHHAMRCECHTSNPFMFMSPRANCCRRVTAAALVRDLDHLLTCLVLPYFNLPIRSAHLLYPWNTEHHTFALLYCVAHGRRDCPTFPRVATSHPVLFGTSTTCCHEIAFCRDPPCRPSMLW